MASLLLAHFSDLHLTEPRPTRPAELANKRLLGFLSWRWRRRHRHSNARIQELVRDAWAQQASHVLVTGDLTQVGLPGEHRQGRRWLEGLGSPDRVTVIPGNHDTYVPTPWDQGPGLWGPYLPSSGTGPDGAPDAPFPIYRELDRVALIGLSTAVPSAPFLAVGRVGPSQRRRLEDLLMAAGERGLFRIVALHHPPLSGVVGRRKALTDRGEVAKVLQRAGAELILFGHTHRSGRYRLGGAESGIPALGVPSASALSPDPEHRAAYNLIRMEGEPGAWEVQVSHRQAGILHASPSWVPLPLAAT